MEQELRIAYFPDTYGEIDGVANTSRQFEAFARKCGLPLLIVCGGNEDASEEAGSVRRETCRRGPIAFRLDKKHRFDLAFWRHHGRVAEVVRKFDPDILHITGPSDAGQLGALIAHEQRIPLAASWHTNLHEYAEQRASSLWGPLPEAWRVGAGRTVREGCLRAVLRFYQMAQILFAPNQELMSLVERGTGKPVSAMQRGVDTQLFRPERRERNDGEFVIGYVGRLTVEKNIHFLAELEERLRESGLRNFRFSIVGQGTEEAWLEANMKRAEFTGVLRGEALARAYANMDVFVFPSRTDTFGNVVLEALASGVPAIVTESGGPRYLVRHGETGFVARSAGEFVERVRELAEDGEKRQRMSVAARDSTLGASWDAIFETLYAGYLRGLREGPMGQKKTRVRPQPSYVG